MKYSPLGYVYSVEGRGLEKAMTTKILKAALLAAAAFIAFVASSPAEAQTGTAPAHHISAESR